MKKEEYSLVYKAIHGDSHAYGELIHQYNCRLPRLLTQQGLTTIERVDDAG